MSRAVRTLVLLLPLVLVLRCMPGQAPHATNVPIVFVHGNGDDASRWFPVIWLFESNGYPADRLFAIRFHNPVARTDDTRDEAARSSTAQARAELADFVQTVLRQTHAEKVVLVGSSRGGLTIRNYVQNGDGARYVSAEILCGTPNHGVSVSESNLNSEFNGKGTFLTALNHLSAEDTETVRGVRTLTLRSDSLDKYAQPMGVALGQPDRPTGITYEGPALKGAQNVVLAGKDHRELAFSAEAFAEMYRFVTGRAPAAMKVKAEASPSISGLITGFAGQVPTNDPLAAVHLRVTPITASGTGAVVYETTTTSTGVWGPVQVQPGTTYSFELEKEGRHVTYYLPTLPRSTSILNFRFLPASPETSGKTGILVLRPDGYFSRDRDPVRIAGTVAAEEPAGLPVRDSFVTAVQPGNKPIHVVLRDESIYIDPSADMVNHLNVAEFLK